MHSGGDKNPPARVAYRSRPLLTGLMIHNVDLARVTPNGRRWFSNIFRCIVRILLFNSHR
uniref:C2 domain-containing protein n=1 Tax=Parascaris univalens TaxID=6257 RepID=A0A915AED3_PARUN